MEKINTGYTNIQNKEIQEKIKGLVEEKKFVWVFKSMSLWVALYPIIIEGKDTFLVRMKSLNEYMFEITDSLEVVNTIIKRETQQAQWLDKKELDKVKEFLKETDKIDLTEVFI